MTLGAENTAELVDQSPVYRPAEEHMDLDIVVPGNGKPEFYIFHLGKFEEWIEWIEYLPALRTINFVGLSGKVKPLGRTINESVAGKIATAKQAAVIGIDNNKSSSLMVPTVIVRNQGE